MAVNTQQLIADLSVYGTINYCDVHSDYSYVIVIEGVSEEDKTTVESIVESACSTDYPVYLSCTLVNGVFKCERNK